MQFQFKLWRLPGNVSSLGLTLVFDDPSRGSCYVKGIQAGGMVDVENARLRRCQPTSDQLQLRDRVMVVNAKTASREMAKELHTAPHLQMWVVRLAQASGHAVVAQPPPPPLPATGAGQAGAYGHGGAQASDSWTQQDPWTQAVVAQRAHAPSIDRARVHR